MSKKYFGTDGVRGRVGELPITPELVLRLGYAAGRVLAAESAGRRGETPAVLIGKDTRISGYLLEAALEAGPFQPYRDVLAQTFFRVGADRIVSGDSHDELRNALGSNRIVAAEVEHEGPFGSSDPAGCLDAGVLRRPSERQSASTHKG